MKNEKNIEKRKSLAIANECRSFLFMYDFITDKENEKIFKRIKKFQDKNKIGISRKQLDSVEIIYNDDIK